MAKKPSKVQETLVTFVLDRSGSMNDCREATIEAFNAYLGELRTAKTPMAFTLIQFDSQSIDKVYFEKAPKDVPTLDRATYQPRGGTPLIEAATKTIEALDAALAIKASKPKVVVCIQTDGEENQSGPEYTWDRLKALIAERTAAGWQFNFMGAGIDAYQQGARMGISRGSTVSYDHHNMQATNDLFVASASNTRSFAAGLSASTAYTASQKMAAGDKYDIPGGLTGGLASPVKPVSSKRLDLSSGSGTGGSPKKAGLDLTSK